MSSLKTLPPAWHNEDIFMLHGNWCDKNRSLTLSRMLGIEWKTYWNFGWWEMFETERRNFPFIYVALLTKNAQCFCCNVNGKWWQSFPFGRLIWEKYYHCRGLLLFFNITATEFLWQTARSRNLALTKWWLTMLNKTVLSTASLISDRQNIFILTLWILSMV